MRPAATHRLANSRLPGQYERIAGAACRRRASVCRSTATVIAATSVIFSAAYLLWALQRIIYNPLTKPENEGMKDLNWREVGLMVPLLAAILWLGVYPKPLLDKTEPAARRLVHLVETNAARPPVTASNTSR